MTPLSALPPPGPGSSLSLLPAPPPGRRYPYVLLAAPAILAPPHINRAAPQPAQAQPGPVAAVIAQLPPDVSAAAVAHTQRAPGPPPVAGAMRTPGPPPRGCAALVLPLQRGEAAGAADLLGERSPEVLPSRRLRSVTREKPPVRGERPFPAWAPRGVSVASARAEEQRGHRGLENRAAWRG